MTSDAVFTSTFILCVVAMVCAVPAYAQIRKKAPHLSGHRHGKIRTEFLNRADLLGIALFLSIYGTYLIAAQSPPELNPDGTVREIKITPPILAAQIISQIVPGIIVMALLMFRNMNIVEFFGLRWKNARYLIVIAPMGVILTYLFFFIVEDSGYMDFLKEIFGDDSKEQETVRIYKETSAGTIRLLIGLSVCVVAPLVEEIVFRGYIYAATKRFTDRFFAAAFSSLLFAVVHFNINALLPLFLLALILTLAYELTGSLWAPISIHALFNASNLVMLEMRIPNQ
ncbi:MAG: CPBP family intramembrane metalloprotease [Verrucomicrobiae bacterium]|nr:CPBP family intramembrane metalloprotease [Verrucomicrobiae bacterium]NNJ41769.1 CPBP family intramembrane metalloprotease [Akkermansiaceae bacterium]